jgi:hypothetical protein
VRADRRDHHDVPLAALESVDGPAPDLGFRKSGLLESCGELALVGG